MIEALKELTPNLFYLVAVGGVLLFFSILLLILARMTKPQFYLALEKHFKKRVQHYSAYLALVATLGSLWLSEIAQYTPCKLCWLQRIMMYPLVIILGVAAIKKQSRKMTVLLMTAIGGVIAAYHYGVQRLTFFQQLAPCQATASCSSTYLGYWGWYSIPLMAFTIFAAIFVLQLLFARKE